MVEVLTFDQATNRVCFTVMTVDDQIHEEDVENLNLDLSTMAKDITLIWNLAQVQIRDDDSEISINFTHIFIT